MGRCRVRECHENHSRHFCRVCKEKDTDHFSSKCPNAKTLYHGTHSGALEPIKQNGLIGSGGGRLGPGVYFVEKFEEAKKISRNRQQKADKYKNYTTVVLKCKVRLGKHTDLGRGEGDGWQTNWHSASTMHPPWAGIGYHFKEYCLKDSSYCVVNTIYVDGDAIKKDVNFTWTEAQRFY